MTAQPIWKPFKKVPVEGLLEIHVYCINLVSLIHILIDSVIIDYKCLQSIFDTCLAFI